MGLFDGPVQGFAEKFCKHLDERVTLRYNASAEAAAKKDTWEQMKNAIIGETLAEISAALKTIAGL